MTRRSVMTLATVLLGACALTLLACDSDDDGSPRDGTVAEAGPLPDAGVDAPATPDAAHDDAAGSTGLWAVLVRGTLFTTDLGQAKTKHDAVAGGGESAAKAAGDIGHDVLLGTSLLGTTENQFLGIDLWNRADNLQAFYSNPDFAAAFASLFDGAPPQPEIFVHQPGWHQWGDMHAGDSFSPYYFVVVRGRLAESDAAKAQQVHDQVAAAGEPQAKAAGDVAHVVFTGLTDAQEILVVDIWKDDTNLEALYTNPDFQQAFSQLFAAPPSLAVYRSTDWHQW